MKVTKITRQIRKILPLKPCGAVIVAAGNATRMDGIDKVMAPIDGEPMILRAVRAFQESDVIRQIVVVTRQELIESVMELCSGCDKVRAVLVGGADRPESVRIGVYALSEEMKLVAVHDGARPFVSAQVIDRAVRAANTYAAAAPGVPVKDTVKIVEGGVVRSTPVRKTLQAIQTPQVFDVALLKGALEKARKDKAEITDDCSAVERLGMSVKIVEGDERNIKITTPMDLQLAQLLAKESL